MHAWQKAIWLKVPVLVAVFILLASCAAGPASSPTADALPTLAEPDATASAPPTAALSPAPAFSPAPSATPTLAPSETPTADPSSLLDLSDVPDDVRAIVTGPTPTPLALPTKQYAAPAVNPTSTPDPGASVSAQPTEQQRTLYDDYLPGGVKVAESEHFEYWAKDNYFPMDLEEWKLRAEEIYAYVSDRVGAEGVKKIPVAFLPSQKTETCPIRGLTQDTVPPQVIIFADPDSPRSFIYGVLAHELGHAIPAEAFEGGMPNDLALTEGLATYASGKYWDEWMQVPSIHGLIRRYIEAGKYEPLTQILDLPGVYPWQQETGQNCLARRDQLYGEWASFIGYLADRYGWEKVLQLFESARSTVSDGKVTELPSSYQGIFGKPLNQLEVDWLKFVLSQKVQ